MFIFNSPIMVAAIKYIQNKLNKLFIDADKLSG